MISPVASRALSMVLVFGAWAGASEYAPVISPAHPAIRYFEQPADDVVSRLQFPPGRAAIKLADLLERLSISPDSQILAFSKTSFQAAAVSPRNPRAIYFNDEVAVAYTPGAESIEIAALDPSQGARFYQLKGSRIESSQVCLHCHQGNATAGIPGMFVGSVFPNAAGEPYRAGSIVTDHRTPLADRWGGWYVTAKRGQPLDRANGVALDPAEPEVLEPDRKQNLTSLAPLFDGSRYLGQGSDIVALMTFEHQTQAANLITRLNWALRTEAAPAAITREIDELVRYLVFDGEAPLREPVEGTTGFARSFEQLGPKDHAGRSLREFDLRTRLFRYPLSYMIYSRSFQALPQPTRDRIWQGIYNSVTKLTPRESSAVIQIVRETSLNLPAFWGASTP